MGLAPIGIFTDSAPWSILGVDYGVIRPDRKCSFHKAAPAMLVTERVSMSGEMLSIVGERERTYWSCIAGDTMCACA